jgi:acetyl-CoA carboxylase biotin carboxyl carrier protein
MDIRKVKKLIELVKETEIAELEIHEGEESVRIAHTLCHKTEYSFAQQVAPQPQNQPQPVPAIEEAKEQIDTGHKIKSPMIGTVYLASTPGAEPFVKIGQKVNVGDTLCLIEAMKMFHKVEADKAGTISACMVPNGTAVEYDQPLFIID